MDGISRGRAEAHRRLLGELRKHLESYGLRCRDVERIHLPLERGWFHATLRPPEMDVYGNGRLIVVVSVSGSSLRGPAFLVRRGDGLPLGTCSAGDPEAAARDIAARRDQTACGIAAEEAAPEEVAPEEEGSG